MSRGRIGLGSLLIVAGFLLLISKFLFGVEFFNFTSGDFWPFIVLALGAIFELVYFTTGAKPGFLIPGGILITLGLLFFFEVGTDWHFAAYTWPVYIFAVAIGLFQMYLYGGRKKGLLIASSILGILSALAGATIFMEIFFDVINMSLVIPILLIAIGIFIFYRKPAGNHDW